MAEPAASTSRASIDRAKERKITMEDLFALEEWRKHSPDVPDGPWYKDFGSFKLALQCTNPDAADGLFLFVLKGEPEDQALKYSAHFLECEYCRVALEVYRYQRDIARTLGRISTPGQDT